MNYSVILLGATISVSLFLKICVVCGAIDVNSGTENGDLIPLETHLNDAMYGLHVNDPLYQYALDYRKALMGDAIFRGKQDRLDQQVLERINFLRDTKNEVKRPRMVSKHHFDDDFYHEQICGRYNHNDTFHGTPTRSVIADGIAPDGCYYENKENTQLTCNDSSLTEVPQLPLVLDSLTVMKTQIKEVNKTDFGDIYIRKVQFIQNDISEIKPYAFANIKNISTLEIMNNYLEYLAFDIYFGLTDVVALHLDGNKISFDIYQNCTLQQNISHIPLVLPKLRLFSLRQNPIRTIPPQVWAGLRESPVTMLDLTQCSLEHIDKDSFQFLPHLETLYLTGNPKLFTPSLPIAVFEGLKDIPLQGLSLGANGLTSFPTDLLAIVGGSLVTLDLSDNPIDYLQPHDIPPNLTKLTQLNLARCSLLDVGATLNLFPLLRQIDLRNNYLTRLPNMSELTKLNFITLIGNPKPPAAPVDENGGNSRTFIIPDHSFENMTNLINIILTDSPIKKITKNMFSNLKNLQALVLDNTKLETIEDEAFLNLGKLSTLQLRNNPNLTSINSLTFLGLDNLQSLLMDGCGISFPPLPETDNNTDIITDPVGKSLKNLTPDPHRPFVYLPSLIHLELSNNQISDIYPQLFSSPKIVELVLNGNKISSWDVPLFKPNYTESRSEETPAERKFFMSSNQLSYITEAMLDDLKSFNPHQIDFFNNLFMCDMGACQLRDLINSPILEETPLPLYTTWYYKEQYSCLFDTSTEFKILNVSDATCESFGKAVAGPEPPENTGPTGSPTDAILSGSNWMTIIIVSAVAVTSVVAATAIGYKQRAQIRYLIFRAKMNVTSLPRKSKTSMAELINYDYDIFISYHNEDRGFIVEKFLPEVEDPSLALQNNSPLELFQTSFKRDLEAGGDTKCKVGFKVCLHERDFEAGMPITENIVDAVDHSKKVVIVVSKRYLESQWCTFEMNLAYHRLIESKRNSFVVILLEEIPSNLRTKVLNYLMRSRTYLQWPGDAAPPQELRRFWTRLRNSIQSSS